MKSLFGIFFVASFILSPLAASAVFNEPTKSVSACDTQELDRQTAATFSAAKHYLSENMTQLMMKNLSVLQITADTCEDLVQISQDYLANIDWALLQIAGSLKVIKAPAPALSTENSTAIKESN